MNEPIRLKIGFEEIDKALEGGIPTGKIQWITGLNKRPSRLSALDTECLEFSFDALDRQWNQRLIKNKQ